MKNTRFKKIPSMLYLGLLPYLALAQLPVTDVAANAQLVLLNQNMVALNSQLVTLNASMNSLLVQMERNVTATTGTSTLLSQDMTAKRTPASFVLGSPELSELFELKDKIITAYKGTKRNLQTMGNLEKIEKERATKVLADVILQVSSLVAQGSHIASTGELIESADRLSSLKSILAKMNALLDKIAEINTSLLQKNEHRKAIYSLIKTN